MSLDAEHSCAAANCSLADDDEMFSCETCRRWWHYGCANFNPSLFDTATPWYCHSQECDEVAQGSQNREGAHGNKVFQKDDDSDVLVAVDALIEAAKVAQSSVEEREKEIATLKDEITKLKVKLNEASSPPPEQIVVAENSAKSKKLPSDRLEAIRQIDCKHRKMLTSPSGVHSTPFSIKTGQMCENDRCKPSHEDSSRENSSSHQSDMANLLTILNRNQPN